MSLLRWEGPGDEANPTVSLFVNTLLLTKVLPKGSSKQFINNTAHQTYWYMKLVRVTGKSIATKDKY